jgi:hypothetical protein
MVYQKLRSIIGGMVVVMASAFMMALYVPNDSVQLVFSGADASNQRACHLYVHESGKDSGGVFFAKVSTSYAHSGETADPIVVKEDPARPRTLSGIGANGKDQLVVFLDQGIPDLQSASSYNLRWWHVNHFHNHRCQQLRLQ